MEEVFLGRKVFQHSPARLSRQKAREMLADGTVHGKPLSKKQRGLFGVVASGKRPRKKGY